MHTPENHQHTAKLDAISQLVRTYQERCRKELKGASTNEIEDRKTHYKRLDILDSLILASGIRRSALVDDLILEIARRPTADTASSAEDICQWLCHLHGQDGAEYALRLRKALVAMQLGNPVTLFNLAQQKLLGEINAKDVDGAHCLVELVLQRVRGPSLLREQALIQSAMIFVDGVAVSVDLNKAHARLLEAARSGSIEGAYNLGLFYDGRFHHGPSPFIDLDLAAYFYSVAQRGGHLAAQTNLSLLNIEELIHSPDPEWGWELLRDASLKGDLAAKDCIVKLSLHL